jgi:hypothetical protein
MPSSPPLLLWLAPLLLLLPAQLLVRGQDNSDVVQEGADAVVDATKDITGNIRDN